MQLKAVALVILIAAPVAAFLLVLNQDVPLTRLEGFNGKCTVCDHRATRTLKRAADELRSKGLYIYRTSEYSSGIPAWCDRHGPDKVRENSGKAYFAAILAFAMTGAACQKVRWPS